MRNVGERTAMNEGGIVLEGLHQVWRQGVLEQHGHGALDLEVAHSNRFLLACIGHDHVPEPVFEIRERRRETENGHDLGCDDDVEAVLARVPVARAAEAHHDVAKRPVVHVDDSTHAIRRTSTPSALP